MFHPPALEQHLLDVAEGAASDSFTDGSSSPKAPTASSSAAASPRRVRARVSPWTRARCSDAEGRDAALPERHLIKMHVGRADVQCDSAGPTRIRFYMTHWRPSRPACDLAPMDPSSHRGLAHFAALPAAGDRQAAWRRRATRGKSGGDLSAAESRRPASPRPDAVRLVCF